MVEISSGGLLWQSLVRTPRARPDQEDKQFVKTIRSRQMMVDSIKDSIREDIRNNKIMLYMKGERNEPQCGFSAQVLNLLNKHNVTFESKNVLSNWDLREGIKAYSNWPTIPQLYVNEKFIGGCDIVMELERKGELKDLLHSSENRLS